MDIFKKKQGIDNPQPEICEALGSACRSREGTRWVLTAASNPGAWSTDGGSRPKLVKTAPAAWSVTCSPSSRFCHFFTVADGAPGGGFSDTTHPMASAVRGMMRIDIACTT